MADLARERASSPKVKAFARKIHKEQQPEIRTMTTWLKAWGEQVPRGIEGAGHNPSATPGMMSTHQMHRLKGALGSAFDTMFLTMMIKHHQGTVDMAKSEQRHGPYGPAKALAADIVTTQTAEIARMRTMLSTGSPTATTRGMSGWRQHRGTAPSGTRLLTGPRATGPTTTPRAYPLPVHLEARPGPCGPAVDLHPPGLDSHHGGRGLWSCARTAV